MTVQKQVSWRAFAIIWAMAWISLVPVISDAGDWPTLRHDQRRSGTCDEQLDASRLIQQWQWQSSLPPAPAWPDAAKWDAYATLEGLRSMRNYDPVLHPIVVGQRVFLPGNADDTVRCLDVASGSILWTFTADGPVRIAPTYHRDMLYFGADDGAVYALEADSGRLAWRTSVSDAPDGAMTESFINDGRICSMMPIRSGVLIDAEKGTGVVSAGMFPWHTTALCGINLESGQVSWRKNLGTGWTLEGSMLLSPSYIIAPQGRSAPLRFDRETGEPQGVMSGGGGSFVLLTEDAKLFHGPGNKGGWITESDTTAAVNKEGSLDKIASFDKGHAIVVKGNFAYLLDDRRLAAFDRQTGEFKWVSPCDCPHELILAGDTLFAGGNDQVLALSATGGEPIWRGQVEGRVMGLAVASGSLFVATDAGCLYRFIEGEMSLPPPTISPTIRQDFDLASGPGPDIVAQKDPELLYRWVFQNGQADSSTDAERGRGPWSVRSLTDAGRPVNLPLGATLAQQGEEQALWLDGRTDSTIAADFHQTPYPKQNLTIEATVRIDKSSEWGGLMSIMQDNGSYEKGWILGYRRDAFGFAVNATDGPDQLTWITNPKNKIQPGQWYHVAATYDGTTARLYVDGDMVADSVAQSGEIQYPEKGSLHLAAYKDDDEHFIAEGMLNEVRLYKRALAPEEIAEHAKQKRGRFTTPKIVQEVRKNDGQTALPKRGPVLRFISPAVAEVRWTSSQPQPSSLRIIDGQGTVDIADRDVARSEHVAYLRNLKPSTVAKYQLDLLVDGRSVPTVDYECDTHFDYSRPELKEASGNLEPQQLRVDALLAMTKLDAPRGMALVWGCPDEARFAETLSRTSNYDVIVLDPDSARIAAARKRLIDAGIYGRAVTARVCETPQAIRIPVGTMNLIIVDDFESIAADQTIDWRLQHQTLLETLQPGGIACLPKAWNDADWWDQVAMTQSGVLSLESSVAPESPPAEMRAVRMSRFEGSSPWSHMYGTAENTAYAGETLSGVRQADDLRIAWAGRPGPRYQSDRGNRKPSPLAADGRLYLQGLYRTIAMDAHNGSILWALEMPEVVRFNVPRDCSNWCADDDDLYIAARDRCLVIDGPTGQIEQEFVVPAVVNDNAKETPLDWGYIARQGEVLIGSGVRPDAPFTEFWGGENWYDSKDGEHSKKVCSDLLFAKDPGTGETLWHYSGGLIVNPTIAIGDNRIHFVECRSKQALQAETRRLDGESFWNDLHLVTIDLNSGKKIWETPAKPMEGESAFYLVATKEKLLMQTSRAGTFAMYAIDPATGKGLWRAKYDWQADHHGKHLSRPAVVEDTIYLRPLRLNLADGSVISQEFPDGHQCGTYTASRDAVFMRAGSLAVWDRISNVATRWDRLRPDCWISTIPAEGMLLSPEGGGGCSCGGWIETSIGFAPKWRVR